MNISIKLLLMLYLLIMITVIIFGVVWTLAAIFTPKWALKKAIIPKREDNYIRKRK